MVRKKGLKKKQPKTKSGRAAKKHSQKKTEVSQVKTTSKPDDAATTMTKTQPTDHPDMLETQVMQDSQGQPEVVDEAASAALCASDTASLLRTVGLASEGSNGQEGHEGAEEETRTDDECVKPTEYDSNPHAEPAKPMMMTQIDRNPKWKRLRETSFLLGDRTPVTPAQPPASEQPPSHSGASSSNAAPGPPNTHGTGASSEAASAAPHVAEVEESKPGNSPGVEDVVDSDGGDDEKTKKASAQRGPQKDSIASSA